MNDSIRFSGRWLEFVETPYRDRLGRERRWEFVRRPRSAGACAIVAMTAERPRRLVIVRQYRPPLKAWILEFPAGLIEPGESLASSVERELVQETGCSGVIRSSGPFAYNSPGLSDECVSLVLVDISAAGETAPEPDELIELVWAPLHGLEAFLRSRETLGDRIDAKLWSFAFGFALGTGGLVPLLRS